MGKTIQSASLREVDGWNVKKHSHLTVARHLREKIHVSCDNKRRRGQMSVQCSDERVAEDHQRSGWRSHGAEQKVNNLEKCDCENLAEEKTAEIHQR